MKYRLHTEAKRVIENIHRYSVKQWGLDKGNEYLLGLHEHLEQLSENSALGRPYPEYEGMYVTRYKSHYIFYRKENFGLFVMTVLHTSMNISQRIRDAFY